jgi:cell wall-associated NlpC family hydrolase
VDRRLTPFSGSVALATLRGRVEARAFVTGEAARIRHPLVDLCDSPGGARDRQLLLGDAVTVIERRGPQAFVQAAKDGYCGWLDAAALGPADPAPTHWLAAAASQLYPEPRVQAREIAALSLGARLTVLETGLGKAGRFAATPQGFVPACHLRPLDAPAADPVAVAEQFLGTPYLWGGNSRAGLDCSGLVQAAMLACGRPCPGDADLQQAVGDPLPEGAPLRRGDLLFWQGHVALVVDEARLIHANGHTMSVAYEDTAACIARIAAQGEGGVIRRTRPG